MLSVACEKKPPRAPSPGPGGDGESITGRERVGWDQPAATTAELGTFRYAMYVDGTRSVMADVTCANTPGPNGFACSGRFPAMTPGSHTIELAAFVEEGGLIESPRSSSLRVTVTGLTGPPAGAALAAGERVTTVDGVGLELELVADGLDDPTDLALAPDGRLFIAQRAGRLRIIGTSGETAVDTSAGGSAHLLGVAIDPAFATTRHVYLAHRALTPDGPVFRVTRQREVDGQLVQRIVLLPDVPSGPDGSAVVRFGHDAKLYAAFDAGGDMRAAERMSDWRGKVLRLEPDGRTPADQPASSPVFLSGVDSPRGFAFMADGGIVWLAERRPSGGERLRAFAVSGERPRRTGHRASYGLPEGVGAGSMSLHAGGDIPQFANDLFVAARQAGYILRVRFDGDDPAKPVTTERLLEGRGPMHALTTGADGSIYFASATALWRLVPTASPGFRSDRAPR